MAFNDTLFQLGMDLTRSSTAHEEDFVRSAYATETAVEDTASVGLTSSRTEDRKLCIDLVGAAKMADAQCAEAAIQRAIDQLGLTAAKLFVDIRENGAFSGVAVLGGGHISVAECPRSGLLAINADGTAGISACDTMMAFANAFGAREAVIQKARRPLPADVNAPIPMRATASRRPAVSRQREARAA